MSSSRTQRAAVASPHWAATEAGRAVLASGGNALDAAIATNAMLTVVYPHMCGLGGDMFMLWFDARTGRVHVLNGSGPAPANASVEAFRERGLEGVPVHGPLAATVPGAVRGWDSALSRFGTLPLRELLAPSAAAAAEGVEVSAGLAAWIAQLATDLSRDPVLRTRFLEADGQPLQPGATLRQPELARALYRLADAGASDLYEGDLADELVSATRAAGGLLEHDDLAGYAPEWSEPLRVRYRGLDIFTTPPNSQGITSLVMLNALRFLGAEHMTPGSADHAHALVTAKQIAFAARDRHVSDPAFTHVPTNELLSDEAVQAALERPAPPSTGPVGGDTVYLCTADQEGNVCSLIQSIAYGFGSCFVAGDSGVLLQNRGYYFSFEDGHPNRLEPGKRTLHTLMACLALEDGRPRLVFGTMGADGQPQTNVQVLERSLAGADPQAAVSAPRLLHGRLLLEDDPDRLRIEANMGDDVIEQLVSEGHPVEVMPPLDECMGHANAIALGPDGEVSAGSDPRSDGAGAVV